MRRFAFLIIATLFLTVALVACGGGNDAGSTENDSGTPDGDAANGESLYHKTTIGAASAPGCVTCHSTEEGVVLVGPSHAGVATRAGEYVAGQSAEAYLRESIADPDAHVVDGFVAGVMYQNYAQDLSNVEIADLVAYLLTLD